MIKHVDLWSLGLTVDAVLVACPRDGQEMLARQFKQCTLEGPINACFLPTLAVFECDEMAPNVMLILGPHDDMLELKLTQFEVPKTERINRA